ncbi:MAG: CocE/NonD family hydrolase [Aquirhabdus sp.]
MNLSIYRHLSYFSLLVLLKLTFSVAFAQTIAPTVPVQPSSPMSYSNLPSDTPTEFTPVTVSFNYIKRIVMIPMRDGVKLHTVVIVPRGAKNAPILLTRTPYNAAELASHSESSHLGSILQGYDNATDVIVEGGYIRVVQDVRGKYGSEGDYVMNRPLRGPQNPTPVDHSTDTYDTIDWLIKNIPETNGKIGIIGISYDGFLPLMALVNPHPALKVAVPMNPMVDGWMGDDWFHNGAFRQHNMSYVLEQVVTRKNEAKWFVSNYYDYDMYMRAGSAGEVGKQRGLEQSGFLRKLLAHPSYDAFWRDQAVDKILAQHPVIVPTLLVHSLWDAEDIYGAIAVYKVLKPQDTENNKVFLVVGPWAHGGSIGDGSKLGAISFNSDTARHFRQEILRPFLDNYLQDKVEKIVLPAVSAFETGTNKWRQLESWPSGCNAGCGIIPTKLVLNAGQSLSLTTDNADRIGFDEYISDPAKPVPYRARPIPQSGYDETKGQTWARWLVDDQREASGRTDVLTFTSEVLTAPIKISGEPIANLIASTSGTDSDWIVKLIDVYPDEVFDQRHMGGYQLMISADIFRGRYRENFEVAKPIQPNRALPYRFAMPTVNHVFLPGHRMMVQIQSSWFPLYDRNPQTFVPSIFWAKPGDYKKVMQRVYYSSYIELPIVEASKKVQ